MADETDEAEPTPRPRTPLERALARAAREAARYEAEQVLYREQRNLQHGAGALHALVAMGGLRRLL